MSDFIETSWSKCSTLDDYQERVMLEEFVNKQCGGNQAKAAEILDLHPANLNKYLKGTRPVPVHIVEKFGFRLVDKPKDREFSNMRS